MDLYFADGGRGDDHLLRKHSVISEPRVSNAHDIALRYIIALIRLWPRKVATKHVSKGEKIIITCPPPNGAINGPTKKGGFHKNPCSEKSDFLAQAHFIIQKHCKWTKDYHVFRYLVSDPFKCDRSL